MHKVENHAGRLIEVKLASPLEIGEVKQFVHELMSLIQRVNGRYVGIVDLREAHVFAPDVTEMLIQLLSGNASHVDRTALVIGESATFALQVERVIRSSNNPNRRAFRVPEEAAAWLGEVLTVTERVRLGQFVKGSTATAGAPAKLR
jgi:hypothetical protein